MCGGEWDRDRIETELKSPPLNLKGIIIFGDESQSHGHRSPQIKTEIHLDQIPLKETAAGEPLSMWESEVQLAPAKNLSALTRLLLQPNNTLCFS